MAVSDPQGLLARPLTILERTSEDEDIRALADIIARNEVGCVVIGLPRMMDGSSSKQTEKVEAFVAALRPHISQPIDMRDERLTTFTAQCLMREASPKKSVSRKMDDAVAAAIILQSYLDEGK